METILAHFDGKNIVPDQPLSLPTGQALRVAIESVPSAVPPLPSLPPELEIVEHGGVRVRGTRISLFLVLESLDHGESWDELRQRFPTVPESAVRGLGEYIQQHSDEMQHYLSAERKEIERLRASTKQTLSLEVMRKRAAEKAEVAKP